MPRPTYGVAASRPFDSSSNLSTLSTPAVATPHSLSLRRYSLTPSVEQLIPTRAPRALGGIAQAPELSFNRSSNNDSNANTQLPKFTTHIVVLVIINLCFATVKLVANVHDKTRIVFLLDFIQEIVVAAWVIIGCFEYVPDQWQYALFGSVRRRWAQFQVQDPASDPERGSPNNTSWHDDQAASDPN